MSVPQRARSRSSLERFDEEVLRRAGPFLSLASDRTRATLPSALLSLTVGGDDEEGMVQAVENGIEAAVSAMLRAFPGNIFWDLDHLVVRVVEGARHAASPDEAVAEAFGRIAALQDLFGGETNIRFRYVHDFLYGFDWAKWVARGPETRARIGPFDPPFIEAMLERGGELLQIIEVGDDEKYPPLRDDRPRNPFGFSREPDDETRLLRHLATRALLPVEAWRADADPDWNRPYARLRREAARSLGLDIGEAS